MSDSPTPITKQDVLDALAALKVGRSYAHARRYVWSILMRYGDGARKVHELDPKFYSAVFAAAGGDIITAEKFYGAVIDLPPTITIPTPEDFYGVTLDVPTRSTKSGPPLNHKSPTRPTLRLRMRVLSPLVADLERKLAERAGKPRSRPNYVVNVGNPARRGDDDAPRQYPSDGVKVS